MDVVVVGSLNRDVSVLTQRLPRPGESVTGSGHFTGPGGKGANQAVAVARLGVDVAMVGRVGRDEHGTSLVSGLESEGIDVSAIGVDEEEGTGLAVITIDENGENTIVVSPGANMRLLPDHIRERRELVSDAPVVLVQLEVPTETVLAVCEIATGMLILNPAPARRLPDELLQRVDLLVPNRSELGILTGGPEPTTVEGAIAAAEGLTIDGTVIVTLGAKGAVVIGRGESQRVPAPVVEPVDPTGAGDAFCGALAFAMSRGESLDAAVRWATAAGAVAVTRRGAQDAMPTLEDVERLLRG